MDNTEPTMEEMLKIIEEFKRTNPDDYEYIYLLSSGYEGWATLSSGKEIYINQPRKSGSEIGIALKGLLKRFNKLETENFKKFGIETKNKNMADILEELSLKWDELSK